MKNVIHFIIATLIFSCSSFLQAQENQPEEPTFHFPEGTDLPTADFLTHWEDEYNYGSNNFQSENNMVTLHSYSAVDDNFYNKQLAATRAIAIKNFLVQKGIQESRIRSIAYGDALTADQENSYYQKREVYRTVMVTFESFQPQAHTGPVSQNNEKSFSHDQNNSESQVIEMEEMVINTSDEFNRTWCDTRKLIAEIAFQEYNYWVDDTGNKLKENAPNAVPILVEYYSQIANSKNTALPNYQRLNATSIAQKASENKVAWSAATICYFLRMAGIDESHGFEFSKRHLTYIVKAAHNRSNEENSFWLYDVDEPEAELKVGDIVCMNRKNKAGNLTSYSYNKLLNRFPVSNSLENVRGVSHCDVVVKIVTRNGRQYAQMIGGNKTASGSRGRGVTVNLIEVELNSNGKIKNPERDKIFGVIKLMECNNSF